MEAHCIALELKYQNQALKSGQHGQILNETSNKAKMKKEIDAFETINIELEHSVAKLLTVNENLNKENKTLKKDYKDLYDSIKITRAETIEQTTSLITQNADLKAQIQENVFAIAALKNELRKSKGNRHRFSPNKSFAVYEKTSHRSGLRWKPTGRIFKTVGLRWIPTGKLLDSCTGKVDSEPPHGSNVNISKIHEYKQTRDLSAGTSINVQKEQRFDLSAGTYNNVKQDNLRFKPRTLMSRMMFEQNGSSLAPQCQRSSYIINDSHNVNDRVESIFGPLFDEYFNGENQVVSKSFAVTTADASDKRQEQPNSTSSTSTLATTITT
ncbi:hypothetical protein Tco_1405132 [Tanacetum coccineum]